MENLQGSRLVSAVLATTSAPIVGNGATLSPRQRQRVAVVAVLNAVLVAIAVVAVGRPAIMRLGEGEVDKERRGRDA